MRDHPILFSTPMVRSLLADRKTETRRLFGGIEPLPNGNFHIFGNGGGMVGVCDADVSKHAPDYVRIETGDRLWVRETYLPDPPSDDPSWHENVCSYVEWSGCGSKVSDVPHALRQVDHCIFAADAKWAGTEMRWRPSIHMPRWASRLTLTVKNVRVERLQDINEDDAIAEGVELDSDGWRDYLMPHTQCCASATDSYRTLWDSINRKHPWASNPWVIAYTFTVERQNIDRIAA